MRKKGHYMLVERETNVRVCESCNFEDEDSSCADTLLLSMNHNKEYSDISVECHMSGRNTNAFCLITILIFCQQWMEVMLDAGFVGYKCVRIMVLYPSFGKHPQNHVHKYEKKESSTFSLFRLL